MSACEKKTRLCGVDEAGRGPLAGPVCAAAVVLNPSNPIEGLRDSKKLSEKARERLADEIMEKASAWGMGWATAEEIGRLNILGATLLAMERAVEACEAVLGESVSVAVDGSVLPKTFEGRGEAIVKGDDKVAEISAASILAKTARDERLMEMDMEYPGYGFAKHKGYPTKIHCAALVELGPCPEHRRGFGPVDEAFERRAKGASK